MSDKQTLFLSIFTFLTILAWIAFDIYHASVASTVTPVQQEMIKPLVPRFEIQVISELKKGAQP